MGARGEKSTAGKNADRENWKRVKELGGGNKKAGEAGFKIS